MSLRTLAILAATCLLTASTALALGGQDIRIADISVDLGVAAHDIAAAPDGTLFAACHDDELRTTLNIYRSEDGGTSWSLWTQLESLFVGGEVWLAQMVVTSGSPAKVLVAWVDRGSGSHMRVSQADAATAVPTWVHASIDSTGNLGLSRPRISTRGTLAGPDRVCAAWNIGGDVKYATSADNGTSWSAPLLIYSEFRTVRDVDVVADQFGVVHITWLAVSFGANDTIVRYRRAQANGELLTDWAAVASADSIGSDFLSRLSAAADPAGPGVLLAIGGYVPMRLLTSTDAGLSWGAVQEFDDIENPDAEWGVSGPHILVDSNFGTNPGFYRAVLSPVSGYTGDWTSELMAPNLGATPITAHLAVDNSRGGQPMIAYLHRAFPGGVGFDLWFDAAWRDAPGYGVPEPIDPPDSDGNPIPRAALPGDLDGDGIRELVYSVATNDTFHTLRLRKQGSIYDYYASDDLHPAADYALIDVDGDDDFEVFYFLPDGTLMGRQGSGSALAGYPLDLGLGASAGWISGAQVTGAAEAEVVVAGGSSVWLLGPGGVARPGFPFVAPGPAGQANGRTALGDVNADGLMEMVASFTGGVVVLDQAAQILSSIGLGEASPGNPSLADLDDDGDLEIAIPRADGTVNLVHHDGTAIGPQWPYDTGAAGLPSQVALADLAGGDRRELVFMAADRTVHLLSTTALTPGGWPISVDPATAVTEPIVAQLGTGDLSIVTGGADGVLKVRDVGGPQEGWPRDLAAAVTASASAVDFDDDGIMELLIPTAGAMWTLDMGVAVLTEPRDWPISGADVGRTGNVDLGNGGGVSPVPETPALALQFHGATPNPFNPLTHLRFRLPRAADHAVLRVYDAAGRLVRTLHQGPLAAGEHAVLWRGVDEGGRAVSSGIYFGRLEADGTVRSRPMVLVR